ncbi:hypothetical protein Tco_0976949 [Tanacetum coccineum]|uniref:Uncharacterized protein n=1 Tax=Tanacetum coccineum TaxID=301880 RepID=A0ABQ5EIY8_9ASTR
MVEKNDLFEELIIAVVDTELNLTEFDRHTHQVGDLEEQCLLLEHHNHLEAVLVQARYDSPERISKKRTKNEAKTTKPDTEWKSKVNQSQRNGQQQKDKQSKSKPTMKNT